MAYLEDLPERHETHDTSEAAEVAFEAAVRKSGLFFIQGKDRQDYGTDFQIEVRDGKRMTNMRVHVQLKGTVTAANADGSISVQVDRTNLNYLLNQADSLYVCFHVPSARLLARQVQDVYREYEHRDSNWSQQTQLTVRFSETFDEGFQQLMHARILAIGKSARDHRLQWTATPPERIPTMVVKSVPLVDVPPERATAFAILTQLYRAGQDAVISGSFTRFAAVLNSTPSALDQAYMAEFNLGLTLQR